MARKKLKQRWSFVYLFLAMVLLSGCKNSLFDFPPPLNQEPAAVWVTQPITSLIVQFIATDSYDPDGEIVAFRWDFGDGTRGEGRTPFHTYQEAGDYFVTLEVTDDDEAVGTSTMSISVHPGNKPPVAILSTNATEGSVDFVWQFNGSASYDTDGYIDRYRFDIVRRTDNHIIGTFNGSQNNIVYMFDRAALLGKTYMLFEIRLTVFDDLGGSHFTARVIKVTSAEWKDN